MRPLKPTPTVLLGAAGALALTALGLAACQAGAVAGAGGGRDAGPDASDIFEQVTVCDPHDPLLDMDGDGWTGARGDCNDCVAQINPGAMEFAGNSRDDDCNGRADDAAPACDGALALTSSDPVDGARALGLCKRQSGDGWGLVSAEYVTADGQPLAKFDPGGLGFGLLPSFGPNVAPQHGSRMLVLSTGTARRPGDLGYESPFGCDKGYPGVGKPSTATPAGFPKESPACPGVVTGEAHDSVGLRLKIRTPSNARALRFDLNFYTYEFPNYVCTKYNDFFVALLTPSPAGYPDGNVSFDGKGNLVSVNAGFLQVCNAQRVDGKDYACPLGPAQLLGTGFDTDYVGTPTSNSAATGWLQTAVPVEHPGAELTLLLAIWDSFDGVLDSTVLLDNFTFLDEMPSAESGPVTSPK